MPKSKKLTAVYALIMDLPLSIVVTIVALALGGNLSMERFIPSFCLAYVLTFFINFLPVGMIGFKFASKHAEDNTFKFGLLANMIIALYKALTEFFPKDVLVWQNNIPDEGKSHLIEKGKEENFEGDDARSTKGNEELGTVPFIFAFVPVWWEEDFKGEGRTVEDGPNYRWQFMVRYPEGYKLGRRRQVDQGRAYPGIHRTG